MKISVMMLIVMLLLPVWGCKERPFSEGTKYKSLRSMQTNDIQELRKRISEIEGDSTGKHNYITELGQRYYKLGLMYSDARNWDQSIEALEKSITYGKDKAMTYYSLGIAYSNRGKELKKSEDIARAEHNYRKAIEQSRDFSDARYGLGILLFYEKEDKPEGLKVMEDLVSMNRNYYMGFFALARFYYEMDKPEKALSIYEDLYAQLQKKSGDSRLMKEYREKCRENIQRLMQELSKS